MSARITRSKFHSIRRDLIEATGNNPKLLTMTAKKALSKRHDVSLETLRIMNTTKTWPQFEAYKKLKRDNATAVRKAKEQAEARRARAEAKRTQPQLGDVTLGHVTFKRVDMPSRRSPVVPASKRNVAGSPDGLRRVQRAFTALDKNGKSLDDRILDLEVEVERLKAKQPRNFWERLFGRQY